MSDLFVGRGIAFPMRVNATGGIALVSSDDEIAESMRLILGTSPGERPMRPDFGCPIHDHVFAPADAVDHRHDRASRCATRWPAGSRGSTSSTSSSRQDERQPTLLYIDIEYAIRDTNDPRNLVFPFYVIPDEE